MPRRTFTDAEVLRIRALEGTAPAQDVGALYGVGAETVRRVWRRETYWQVKAVVAAPESETVESLGRLQGLLSQEPEEPEEGAPSGNVA